MMNITKKSRMPVDRKVTFGTKEWADYNINCIKGCYNNCRYCYARIMANRFRRSTNGTWKDMRVRDDALKKIFRKRVGRAMFPSTHDIFDFSPFKEACFTVLGNLLAGKNDVLVTTKPRFAIVKGITEQFECYREQIQFRFTITSNNNELLKFWEPNAPSYAERFEALKYAFNKGFKTSVSVEPFLDYDPIKLVEALTPFTTESIWIGRMNYISRNGLSTQEIQYYKEIHKNYENSHLYELYNELTINPKIRIKDSIRIQLSEAGLLESGIPISASIIQK